MKLERILKATTNLGKNFLLGTLAVGLVSLSGCGKIMDSRTGGVHGRVNIPSIENNQVVWNGIPNLGVNLSPEYKTMTDKDGEYWLNKVDEGDYSLVANTPIDSWGRGLNFNYSKATIPVRVNKDKITENSEIRLVPTDYSKKVKSIIYGKVFNSDSTVYNGDLLIRGAVPNDDDWLPGPLVDSTTTLKDGSYAFYEPALLPIIFTNSQGKKVLIEGENTGMISDGDFISGVVKKNLYVKR